MSLQRALYNAVNATRREMIAAYNYATRAPGEMPELEWQEYALAEDRWRKALRTYNSRAQQFGWDLILDDEE